MEKLIEKAKLIKLFIVDVDGVLTDGKIYRTDKGDEIKAFNVHDGLGIKLLKQAHINTAIITSRLSEVVKHRAAELGIDYVYQGQADKRSAYKDLCETLKITDEQVCYIGDDLPDLPILKRVGLSVTVANATPVILQQVDWVVDKNGGDGAVRQVVDFVIASQGLWPTIMERFN